MNQSKDFRHSIRMFSLLVWTGLLLPIHLSAQTTPVIYQANPADFANPERGFYHYSETKASDYEPLDASDLLANRSLHTPAGATYSIYSSLVFRYFVLDDFKTSDISADFLNRMQTDFVAARTAGVKVIVRFAYTIEVANTNCGGDICPPYGDASKTWVLTHIGQLTPVLQANKDVIAVVQAGFIGIWGENYYTDFFGDASSEGQGFLSPQNWSYRNEVLGALLNALPTDRMVQVRYPQIKQKYVYGISASPDPALSPPLTDAQAYTGIPIARIGHHNDCLLASEDDFGTYYDYDDPVNADTAHLKPYLAGDSRFVAVGGETCFKYNPFNDCSSTDPDAYGDTEITRMHYSYLNADYNNAVNNDWQSGGCMDNIKKRLGYRLVLQNGDFSNQAQPGQAISIHISLKNEGFAAPFNPRGVELILRNTSTSQRWYARLPDDPRFWLADGATYTINSTVCIPVAMPAGSYELLLNLPDPAPSLYARPEFSIRLANLLPGGADVWETATGYNKLGHTISINNVAANPACTGSEPVFVLGSIFLPIELTSFKATALPASVRLDWTTALEKNNRGFNLQRSSDHLEFATIAWVDGQGNSSQTTRYFYHDENPVPDQTNYYRLEQVDFDGTLTCSNIVSAFTGAGKNQDIIIFPQPAFGPIKIRFNPVISGEIKLKVTNVLGEMLDEVFLMDGTGEYDCSKLPEGVFYFLFEWNGKQAVKKVIVR